MITACVIVGAALALALTPRMVGYLRAMTGRRLIPFMYPEKARTEAVPLAPGSYVAGQVLGQMGNVTARSEVQNANVSSGNGGSVYFTVGCASQFLAYNANAATACTVLNTLFVNAYGSNANNGVAVTGGAGAWTLSYQNALGNKPQPLLTATNGNMTGTGAAIAVTRVTAGQYAGGGYASYVDGNSDGTQVAKGALEFDTTVNGLGEHFYGGGEWGESFRTAPMYVDGYFRTADLTGLDAAAVADLGRLISGDTGNLTGNQGVLKMG